MPDLNESVEVVVQDSEVITVPIDDTLTNSGEAADAKAVGDALALKADRSELQTTITVNGQSADAQGKIIVTGADTKMSSTDNTTLKSKIESVDGKTAADIKVSSDQDSETIAEALSNGATRTADMIEMSASDTTKVKTAIDTLTGSLNNLSDTVTTLSGKTAADIKYNTGSEETIKQHIDAMSAGTVKSVNDILPNASGNVVLNRVPYADNLATEEMEQVDDTFIARTTGGSLGISGQNAWILRLMGNRTHTGYVAESIVLTVIPMPRSAPAAITVSIDEAAFEAAVGVAGTYVYNYDGEDWDTDPTDYGMTIANTPIDGDKITVVWDGESNAVVTVDAAARTAPDAITATIDRDTFVSYVSTSGTTTLTYSTGWSADPALYGITVSNDPVAGDQITVVYVKEVRGTITQSAPTSLVATGWNLYDHTNGYAKVVKYSTTYGYKVGGTYTSIAFATTPTGDQTAVTPDANGIFNVTDDGYIIVTGGDATTTYILPVWSDWSSGYTGDWKAYTTDTVDFSSIMTANFPYGLCRVNNTRDEIDCNQKQAISRIQRMAYSEENRASAAASGRDYEFDENYIYLVRATPVVTSITIDEEYDCDDHGLEWFTDTAVPVYAEILYGQNLKDKLRRDVITCRMTVTQVKGM